MPYRIKKVTSLQAQGYGLDEIAAILGQDWEAEREAFEREQKGISRGLPSVPEMIAGNLAMAVSFKVGGILGEGPGRPESTATIAVRTALGKKETVKRAIDLLQEGYHPVAVFDGTTVSVLPDIAVDLKISSLPTADFQALVVVSLLPELAESCEEHGVQFPRTRAFPAPKAWIRVGEGRRPLQVQPLAERGESLAGEGGVRLVAVLRGPPEDTLPLGDCGLVFLLMGPGPVGLLGVNLRLLLPPSLMGLLVDLLVALACPEQILTLVPFLPPTLPACQVSSRFRGMTPLGFQST